MTLSLVSQSESGSSCPSSSTHLACLPLVPLPQLTEHYKWRDQNKRDQSSSQRTTTNSNNHACKARNCGTHLRPVGVGPEGGQALASTGHEVVWFGAQHTATFSVTHYFDLREPCLLDTVSLLTPHPHPATHRTLTLVEYPPPVIRTRVQLVFHLNKWKRKWNKEQKSRRRGEGKQLRFKENCNIFLLLVLFSAQRVFEKYRALKLQYPTFYQYYSESKHISYIRF